MGLLEALKQFAGDAAGGSLNPEVSNTLSGLLNYGKDRAKYIGGLLDDSSPINKDFKNWHDRTQLGLADLIAGKEGPQADYGYSQIMNMAGVAPLGITAWHGSPHKFDKFSLDKIGTGEGAQAYGHGLYLAENPEVGKEYARVLTKNAFFDGKPIYEIDPNTLGRRDTLLNEVVNVGADARGALPGRRTPSGLSSDYEGPIAAMKALVQSGKVPKNATKWVDENGNIKVSSVEPQLYKTDIPDEAVARFLDWDKPLSQQAPEVQAVLSAYKGVPAQGGEGWGKVAGKSVDRTGADIYLDISTKKGTGNRADQSATEYFQSLGIPGIRYLDGGSRSAGQGSSNFVAFDPEMIRILERNGQPTGLEPWKPGEYRLGDLLK